MSLSSLTTPLVKEFGIELEAEDPDGAVEITINDDMVIEIHKDPTGMGFLMSASVGGVPNENRQAVFTELLEANLLGQGTLGARLSIDGALNEIVMCRTYSDQKMPYEVFSADFRRFVEALDFWRSRLAAGQIGSDEELPDGSGETDGPEIGGMAIKV